MSALVRDSARACGNSVTRDAVLCEGAYAGLISSGDLATHDRIAATILEEMIRRNEVIHLARSPMVRVAAGIWPVPGVPILTSTRLAVGRLAGLSRSRQAMPHGQSRPSSAKTPAGQSTQLKQAPFTTCAACACRGVPIGSSMPDHPGPSVQMCEHFLGMPRNDIIADPDPRLEAYITAAAPRGQGTHAARRLLR